MKNQVYQIITDKIIAELQTGNIVWNRGWKCGLPKNLISGESYRGINLLLLSFSKFESPYFLTFKQAQDLGGSVKKGEKGTMITFFKNFSTKTTRNQDGSEDEEDITTEQAYFVLRYYTVFNSEQCENLKSKKLDELKNAPKIDSNAQAELIVKNYKTCPEIKHGGDRAFYSPTQDYVQLPIQDSFISTGSYYSTLFHELVHSTGKGTRLNRFNGANSIFGSEDYSKEELIAELGSAFIGGSIGIQDHKEITNKAAYIQSWLKALKNDVKFVFQASSGAQKAVDYIKS
jgi:antirestriction protein ArdC